MRLLPVVVLLTACVPELTSPDDSGDEFACDANSWPVGSGELENADEGYFEGNRLPDFALQDQHGQDTCLYQFAGMAAVVDVSALWCGPCQELANYTQHTQDTYGDPDEDGVADFIYITLHNTNLNSEDPTVDDLTFWAERFDITSAPVVGDEDNAYYTTPMLNEGAVGMPLVLVLDRELKIVDRLEGAEEEHVDAAVASVLGL